MVRSSRNIVLTLLGSAALCGCCLTSCVDARDDVQRDANGNEVRDAQGHVVHRRHYFFRPWWPWWHSGGYSRGYGPFWTSTRSYSPSYTSGGRSSTGSSSGGSHSTSGTTSRGGFGSTGHATAGG